MCGRTARSAPRCVSCSATALPALNIGRVWDDPVPAERGSGAAALQKIARSPAFTLTAFRCPSCGHDWVLDGDARAGMGSRRDRLHRPRLLVMTHVPRIDECNGKRRLETIA